MITTSRSAVAAYQRCPRLRYHQYESPNGTATPGWERRKLAIPLVTGIYVHQGLEQALKGVEAAEAAAGAKVEYLKEVSARGLAVEEGTDEAAVVEEQAAHVEALVLAWARVRLPHWLSEYEVVEVEVEDRVPLSDDVVLASRADAVVRRKADHRMFVVNFKTVAQADERWLRGWEVDMQLMTELLAAERRHGHEFGGVIIEGLIKGRRMPEKGADGSVTGYRDSSPLLYGYKCDADPPLTPLQYQSEYTKRKGWRRFSTWNEHFPQVTFEPVPAGAVRGADLPDSVTTQALSPLAYWINWLPEEIVEGQFCIVPPIMRDQEKIESKVIQIVAMEQRIKEGLEFHQYQDNRFNLDVAFPQNEHSCVYPSKCAMYDACHTSNVSQDMAGSGLFQPRADHHALKGGE